MKSGHIAVCYFVEVVIAMHTKPWDLRRNKFNQHNFVPTWSIRN